MTQIKRRQWPHCRFQFCSAALWVADLLALPVLAGCIGSGLQSFTSAALRHIADIIKHVFADAVSLSIHLDGGATALDFDRSRPGSVLAGIVRDIRLGLPAVRRLKHQVGAHLQGEGGAVCESVKSSEWADRLNLLTLENTHCRTHCGWCCMVCAAPRHSHLAAR